MDNHLRLVSSTKPLEDCTQIYFFNVQVDTVLTMTKNDLGAKESEVLE